MANTLTRMERDGLIGRTRHPEDGRAQQVWLTERARALREPAIQAAMEQNEAALSGLSDQERQLFIGLMRRVMASMKATST